MLANPFQSEFHWVESHTDTYKPGEERTLREQGNIYVAALADGALTAAVQDGIVVDSDFPLEQLRVKTGVSKVTGLLQKAVCHSTGKH